jgi:hypothetical protein
MYNSRKDFSSKWAEYLMCKYVNARFLDSSVNTVTRPVNISIHNSMQQTRPLEATRS